MKGEKVAKVSLLAVILIGLIKGTTGLLSGSIALQAQGIDSLTDFLSYLTIYVGMRLTRKVPNEKFPYGYYKAENLAALIVSILILIGGVIISIESFQRIINPISISFPIITTFVAAGSIPIIYLLANYNRKVAHEINSQALDGGARDFTMDIFSSLLVLFGVLSFFLGLPWLEPIAGMIISIFILKTGFQLGRDAILVLLDAVESPELAKGISEIAEKIPSVKNVHDIKLRRSGPFCFGELHMDVEPGLSVERAHSISGEVEFAVKEKYKMIESLSIHIEPAEKQTERIAIPIVRDMGLDSKPSPHFGGALYFIIVEREKEEIGNWHIITNPASKMEKKKGIETATFLLNKKIDSLLVSKLGPGPFHMLKDNNLEIYKIHKFEKIKTLIDYYINNQLETLIKPNK